MGLTTTALRREMLACIRCAALVQCRSRVVPGAGAIPATIAFVGLAPGRLGADRTGVPFSGDRSGDLLRRMIRRTGLQRVFITNLIRCNPRDSQGRNRDPHAAEIANCRGFLATELELARPTVVACLGRIAWRELAGRDIEFNPRRPLIVTRDSYMVFPLYHPAYVNRGSVSEDDYLLQFSALRGLLDERARLAKRSLRVERDSAAA